MANTYVTMQEVAEDLLIDFQNALLITATADRQYEDDITNAHTDTGGSVKIRKPVRYNVGDGAVISGTTSTEEKSTTLTIDKRKHVEANFTTVDLTLSTKDQFRKRFIKPMGVHLANKVDLDVGNDIANAINYFSGTAGVRPSAFSAAADIAANMDLLGMPTNDRWLAFGPKAYASFISAGSLQNSFNTEMNKSITRNGQLGRVADFQSYKTIYTRQQIAGIGEVAATPSAGFVDAGNVKTTVTSGSTIVVEGLGGPTTGVYNPGDKIKIAGVFSVNPISKISTGELMTFVITNAAAVNSSAGGEATITVSPAIISSSTDAYRNISNTSGITGGAGSLVTLASANSGAGSTTLSPYEINMAYVPGGVIFAAPPLVLPRGLPADAMGRAVDPETKVSIRILETYDGINDKQITRADIIYGTDVQNDFVYGLLG